MDTRIFKYPIIVSLVIAAGLTLAMIAGLVSLPWWVPLAVAAAPFALMGAAMVLFIMAWMAGGSH